MFHWEGEVMEGFSETLIWRNHVRKRNIVLSRYVIQVYMEYNFQNHQKKVTVILLLKWIRIKGKHLANKLLYCIYFGRLMGRIREDVIYAITSTESFRVLLLDTKKRNEMDDLW